MSCYMAMHRDGACCCSSLAVCIRPRRPVAASARIGHRRARGLGSAALVLSWVGLWKAPSATWQQTAAHSASPGIIRMPLSVAETERLSGWNKGKADPLNSTISTSADCFQACSPWVVVLKKIKKCTQLVAHYGIVLPSPTAAGQKAGRPNQSRARSLSSQGRGQHSTTSRLWMLPCPHSSFFARTSLGRLDESPVTY